MNQTFSFFLSKGAGSTGNLKFGGYDLSKYAKKGSTDKDIAWINLAEDDSWTIPLNGLQFMDGGKVNLKSEQLTLDTGLSYALVPPRDIEDIILSLKDSQNFTCKKEGQLDLDMYVCNCDQN